MGNMTEKMMLTKCSRSGFDSEQLTANRFKAVEKLLQMLVLVVRQPGALGLTLLPKFLDFALNYVSPLLVQGRDPTEICDVALALLDLFDG